jgi:hypothetical protein
MPKWIRVRDRETGHTFDVAESTVEANPDTYEVVKGVEPVEGLTAKPRPAEHYTGSAKAAASKNKES